MALAGTLVAGCAGDPTSQISTSSSTDSSYQVPDERRYEERWLPTDVVDQDSPDGTFIRALLEATSLTVFVGSREASYPGYADAVASAIATENAPDVEPYIMPRPAYGAKYRRVVSMQEMPGNIVRVVGCDTSPGTPLTAETDPTPRDEWQVGGFLLVYERVGLIAPPTNQYGPRAVPIDSVFGSWQVKEFDPSYELVNRDSMTPCTSDSLNANDTIQFGWPTVAQPRA